MRWSRLIRQNINQNIEALILALYIMYIALHAFPADPQISIHLMVRSATF